MRAQHVEKVEEYKRRIGREERTGGGDRRKRKMRGGRKEEGAGGKIGYTPVD